MDYHVTDFEGQKRNVIFHYSELKEDYERIKSYSNEEFLEKLPEILHTTVFICYFKEIPSYVCLGDCGIIHELVHLLNGIETFHYSIDKIRELWQAICKLA